MTAELVVQAFEKAKIERGSRKEMIFHLNLGSLLPINNKTVTRFFLQ